MNQKIICRLLMFKFSFKLFNWKIKLLFLITFIFLTIGAYKALYNPLEIFSKKYIQSLEKHVTIAESSFTLANQVMKNIAASLSNHPITKDNLYIKQIIVENLYIPFQDALFQNIRILDDHDTIIFNNRLPNHFFVPEHNKVFTKLGYFLDCKKLLFKMTFGTVTFQPKINKEILPVCLAITSPEHQYIGAIYGSLSVNRLLDKPKLGSPSLFNKMELFNLNQKKNFLDEVQIGSFFLIKKIIKFYLTGEPVIIYKQLPNYPFVIAAELNSNDLDHDLINTAISSFFYFFILIMFAYCLFIINKKLYQEPFDNVRKDIFELYLNIKTQDKNHTIWHESNFDPTNLLQITKEVIDYSELLMDNNNKHNLQQKKIEKHNNILDVILTESPQYTT